MPPVVFILLAYLCGSLPFSVWMGKAYPLTLFTLEVVAVNSLRLSLTGQLRWKGRELDRPQWKWL